MEFAFYSYLRKHIIFCSTPENKENFLRRTCGCEVEMVPTKTFLPINKRRKKENTSLRFHGNYFCCFCCCYWYCYCYYYCCFCLYNPWWKKIGMFVHPNSHKLIVPTNVFSVPLLTMSISIHIY